MNIKNSLRKLTLTAMLATGISSFGCSSLPAPGNNVVVDAGRYVATPLAVAVDVVDYPLTGLTNFFEKAGEQTAYRAGRVERTPDGVSIDVTSPVSYMFAEIFGGLDNLVRLPAAESAWMQKNESWNEHSMPYLRMTWQKE